MAKKNVVKVEAVGYEVYAPFEFHGESYEAGDVFTVPANMRRDMEYEIFRATGKKRPQENEGIVLLEDLPPATPKGEPQVRRHILPLKEAAPKE